MADEASRSGRCVISDARDFYNWGKTSNMTNVNFRFVSRDICEARAVSVASQSIKSVAGTMKLHAVVGLGDCKILYRNTSCYCADCLTGKMSCSWSKASTHQDMKSPTTNSDTSIAENSSRPLENLTPSEIVRK